MFDICTTIYKCKCGGIVDHYVNKIDVLNSYYKCRNCEAKFFDKTLLKSDTNDN